MPATPPRCRHLHNDGRQCGSPAIRHEKLCYQHHSARQRPSYTPSLPDPEDLHAVRRGLAELLRLVARELVEDRQAKRLFALLAAASTNLGRLAPGPGPEPRPTPAAEPTLKEPGYPTFGAVAPRPRSVPKPEQPSRARQAELDAEAAEQIEFDRREEANREERASLRRVSSQLMYQKLSPEEKIEHDARRAEQLAAFYGNRPIPAHEWTAPELV